MCFRLLLLRGAVVIVANNRSYPHCMLEFIKRITNAKATWQLPPRLTHFRPFVFGACLAIISNHILTFMPTEKHILFSVFSGGRNLLSNNNGQPFTNCIKPNEIKMARMPQTKSDRQAGHFMYPKSIVGKKDIAYEMDLSRSQLCSAKL